MRRADEIYRRVVWRGIDGREYRISSVRDWKFRSVRVLQWFDEKYNWHEFFPEYELMLVEKADDGRERTMGKFTADNLLGKYDDFAVSFHNQATDEKYEHETVGQMAGRLVKQHFLRKQQQAS